MELFRLIDSLPQGDPSSSMKLGETRGPFVDANMTYGDRNWNHRILFTRIEVGEIARHFEFIEPEVWQLRQAELEERIAELEGELARREGNLDAVAGAIAAKVIGLTEQQRPAEPSQLSTDSVAV